MTGDFDNLDFKPGKIETKDYGTIAYSTQEQILIRKAIERHNRLMKALIFAIIILIIFLAALLYLAVQTQLIGKFLIWLTQLRLR